MKEYIDEFSAHLKGRISSPLGKAFLLSWPVWNYKFVLVFFSDMKPYVKFSYISGQVYPDAFHALLLALGGPITTSILYVCLYPFAVQAAMVVTNWHGNRIEKLRQQGANEKPMSEESAKRFRQEQAQMLESLQEKLDDKKEQLRKSQEQESKLESRIIDAELDLASSVKDLSVVKGQYDAEVLAKEKLVNQFEGLEALHEITNEGLKNLQQNNAELEHQISSLMAVRSNEKGQASLLASMHAKAKQLENILSVEKSENKKLLLRISNLEKKITSLMSRSGVVVTPAPRKRYPPVAGDD